MIIGIIRVAAALLLTPLTLTQRHLQPFAHARADAENEVKLILQRIEEDTLKLRDEIENAYSQRCSIETLSQCSRGSFNGCSSVFPNQQCMEADELVVEACGGGGENGCNALWDKTTSIVSIPSALAQGKDDNPTDPELIETACYTLLAEDYMRTKYENDETFWDSYNVQPSWTYFGSHNGLFRKFPGTVDEECGNYDPRLRPWFVAASSGPKDVVLVLDVSGSMSDYGRMDLAKEAAITVIKTLTISDRVAVIAFSDYAYQVHSDSGTDLLVRATNENKNLLIDSIQNLTDGGATNFHAGFQLAFDSLERTIEQEYTSGCNVAILFMTDGVRTAGPETDEVLSLINDSTQRLATLFNRDTKIFTFSLGSQADRLATKEIACSTNGIWTPVDDFDGDLVGAMASYYKLFALGLGDDTEFTAWVEPYEFFWTKKMGTTNSAPVFDRSVDPPLFLGVVANDVHMDAFEQVLGENAQSSTMLQRFIRLSTAQCPKIDLSDCQLEGLRYLAGGEEATCGICNSTDYPGIIPTECPFKPDLPKNLWQNTDVDGVKYEDRACCEIGSNVPSEMCGVPDEIDTTELDTSTNSIGLILGITIPVLFVICCCGWLFCKHKKVSPPTEAPKEVIGTNALPVASVSYAIPANNAHVTYGGITAVMPPSASAPPMNPAFHVRT
ncbi:voltage-dependent calcium channel-like protein [Skeletonema marinoi]|uniref:Voltage-dependent calcium channel-like protein n=1 Tax=Skeletonema marinoi TaxID=267567 RepID=A0AAD8XXT5_9STRA|nr:voltage-dependent calcium channel-like protein [Skeletonema marinoi]